MKLVRFGEPGAEKPGMIDHNGDLRDLSDEVADIAAEALSAKSLEILSKLDPMALPKVEGEVRFGPCVGGTGKFMCIGLNFSDHAAETGSAIPDHPVLFMKATSAMGGAFDDVVLPRGSETSDWEVELGVVIGERCKYVSEAEALDHVAGFCVCNDVSERTFQRKRSGQWTKGKSCDTFGPTGPWLVTKDEIADVQKLGMWLDVNGERMQTGNTDTMIFTVAQCISHLSQMFTLHPGDVISTGTPPGVGMGMAPERYLKAGDVMTLGIDGLGEQRQTVRADG
ncbi:fumarylacetoacetate hydrolase family protein [Jannaschia sp. LMIT008]|uniref:fumarylacetoacetate hydrolase family protein n=1 Tax=Jannaschia maritima TaxID=3032585 RepID=UPI0028116F22|nr:fumarylacetoacetate hydrolase family protein [Jannaschia sp. LMIT008]